MPEPDHPPTRAALLAPLAAALAVRLLALLLLTPSVPISGDSNGYVYQARRFLETGALVGTEYPHVRPPLYFLLVALGLDGDAPPADAFPGVYLLQIAFDLGACALAMAVARRRFGGRAALATGWLTALAPTNVLYSSTIVMAECLAGAFTILALWQWDRLRAALAGAAPRAAVLRNAALLGLALGAGVLMKELVLFVGAALLAGTMLFAAAPLRARAGATAVTALVLAVALVPWALHTERHLGRAMLAGTYGDLALSYDNAPPGEDAYAKWIAGRDAGERIDASRDIFRRALTEYPLLTLARGVTRLRILFGPEIFLPAAVIAYPFDRFVPDISTLARYNRQCWRLPEGSRGRAAQIGLTAAAFAIFALIAAGGILSWRDPLTRQLALLLLAFAAATFLTVAMDRYRQPLLVAFAPLAGAAIAHVQARRPVGRAAGVAIAATALALFAAMFLLGAPQTD